MTQKEEKEWTAMVPRFKEVCCSKLCKNWINCKNHEVRSFLCCPWFFGYRISGWPVRRLADYSYNAVKYPDLRIEEASEEIINEWKQR